MALSQSINQ